jgi:hypothetical protein
MRYFLWRGLGGVVGVMTLISLAYAIGVIVTRFDLMPR